MRLGRTVVLAAAVLGVVASGCTSSGAPSTGAATPSVRPTASAPDASAPPAPDPPAGTGAVLSPDADDAVLHTFDTRILSLRVGGGVLWVVRRADDGMGRRLHRFRDGTDIGMTDLAEGDIVSDAAGDATGLWVATGGPEAVHLDAPSGEVDRRFTTTDAEWLDVGDGMVVVAGPTEGAADGTDVTVADAATGEVVWSARAPRPDWTRLVDVSWMDERAWLAHYEHEDRPDDVRGGLVTMDAGGTVVDAHDVELRHLVSGAGRLVGTSEPLSLREGEDPRVHLIGPRTDDLRTTTVGQSPDAVVVAPAATDEAAWVAVDVVRDDRPRIVELRPDGTTPRAVRLPVPADQLLEQVAVLGTDVWFVTAGPDIGPDGDLPTTLWRLPGAIG